MVLIISWWVQPTVIWPYKACSLHGQQVTSDICLNSLTSGFKAKLFKFGHELLFHLLRTHVLWMFPGRRWAPVLGLFIFFRKNAWADCAYFLMRNYQRYGLIILILRKVRRHIRKRLTLSILFALASCSFWADCCTGLLTEEARGTWAQPISKKDRKTAIKFFHINLTTEEWGAMFTQPSERSTIVI